MKTHNFILGPVDTDSISFCKPDSSPFTEKEQQDLIDEINTYMPELIKYEHDGYYNSVVVLKAKNYALWDGSEIKIKGSAFKSSSRETALKELMGEFLNVMLKEDLKQEELNNKLVSIYHKYILEALNVKDIKRWSSKKTITEKVLNPERTNEQKVFDALQGTEYSEGDKRWFYFKEDDSLSLVENFDGNYNKIHLLKKLYNTIKIFSTVIDIKYFTNYSLKNKKIKEKLCQLK